MYSPPTVLTFASTETFLLQEKFNYETSSVKRRRLQYGYKGEDVAHDIFELVLCKDNGTVEC